MQRLIVERPTRATLSQETRDASAARRRRRLSVAREQTRRCDRRHRRRPSSSSSSVGCPTANFVSHGSRRQVGGGGGDLDLPHSTAAAAAARHTDGGGGARALGGHFDRREQDGWRRGAINAARAPPLRASCACRRALAGD